VTITNDTDETNEVEGSSDARHGPQAGSSTPARRSTQTVASRSWDALTHVSGVFVWAGLVILFGVLAPATFLTSTTAQSIANDQAITVILAVGLLFPLLCGESDMSVAQCLGLSAVVGAALSVHLGQPTVVCIVLTLLVGAGIGIVNGLLVAYVGVNSFITTLGASSVLLALTALISDQQFVGPIPADAQALASGQVLGVPKVAIYAAIVCVVAWYLIDHTPVGRRFQATGLNNEAARLSGLRTRRYVLISFVISGLLASLAGLLVAAKIGTVSPQVGPGYLLPAFAACFLGATQIRPGRYNVGGTVLAVILLATGVKGLQLVGGQPWLTDLFNGVALVGAVTVAVLAQRRRSRR